MSYEFYKLMHLVGIVLLFSGLVSMLTLKVAGIPVEGSVKKFSFITHGLGLLLILVGGFGLLARLQLMADMPKWVYVKLLVWLFMGGAISLVKRKGHLGWSLYIVLLCVFAIAGYVALSKPF